MRNRCEKYCSYDERTSECVTHFHETLIDRIRRNIEKINVHACELPLFALDRSRTSNYCESHVSKKEIESNFWH